MNAKKRAKLELLQAEAEVASKRLEKAKLDLVRQLELMIQDACGVAIHEDLGFEKLSVHQLVRLERYVVELTRAPEPR